MGTADKSGCVRSVSGALSHGFGPEWARFALALWRRQARFSHRDSELTGKWHPERWVA